MLRENLPQYVEENIMMMHWVAFIFFSFDIGLKFITSSLFSSGLVYIITKQPYLVF
jgi:hypothetical protein